MYKKILIVFLFVPLALFSIYIEQGGVRNASLGNCGISSSDDLSAAVWNPALLAKLQNAGLLTDSRKYFWNLINDDLSFNYFTLSYPLGRLGNFAASGSFFDSNNYNESKLGIHYGNYLLRNKLLIGFSMYQYKIGYGQNEFTVNDPFFQEYGYSKYGYDGDFGIAYTFSEKLNFGFTGYNLYRADVALDENNEEKLPRSFGLGVDYQFGKFLFITDIKQIMAEAESQSETAVSLGCEYKLSKIMELRTGFNKYNVTAGFGINILKKEIASVSYDPITSKEMLNTRMFEISLDYMFQYPINGISSEYGDHVIGIELNYRNSSDEVKKLSKFVPPLIEKQYLTPAQVQDIADKEVTIDSLYFDQLALTDTIFIDRIIEKVIFDTVVVFSGVPDSTYMKKARELEAMKAEVGLLRANNKAQWHLLESLKNYYSGDYQKAITECKTAIRLAPGLSISYIRLGSIYLKINEPDRAKFYWKKARQIEPNNPELKRIAKFLE